jgi:hypothetical protein
MVLLPPDLPDALDAGEAQAVGGGELFGRDEPQVRLHLHSTAGSSIQVAGPPGRQLRAQRIPRLYNRPWQERPWGPGRPQLSTMAPCGAAKPAPCWLGILLWLRGPECIRPTTQAESIRHQDAARKRAHCTRPPPRTHAQAYC